MKKSLIFICFLMLSCTATKKMGMMLTEQNPYKDDPESVIRGKQIYHRNCQECHGKLEQNRDPKNRGLPGAPNFAYLAQTRTAKTFAASITYGKGEKMPPFREVLSSKEIWDVSNYLMSFK